MHLYEVCLDTGNERQGPEAGRKVILLNCSATATKQMLLPTTYMLSIRKLTVIFQPTRCPHVHLLDRPTDVPYRFSITSEYFKLKVLSVSERGTRNAV